MGLRWMANPRACPPIPQCLHCLFYDPSAASNALHQNPSMPATYKLQGMLMWSLHPIRPNTHPLTALRTLNGCKSSMPSLICGARARAPPGHSTPTKWLDVQTTLLSVKQDQVQARDWVLGRARRKEAQGAHLSHHELPTHCLESTPRALPKMQSNSKLMGDCRWPLLLDRPGRSAGRNGGHRCGLRVLLLEPNLHIDMKCANQPLHIQSTLEGHACMAALHDMFAWA